MASYSAEEIKQLRDFARSGKTAIEAGLALNRSARSVFKRAQKSGIPLRKFN